MHVLVWPWWCLINIFEVALYVATEGIIFFVILFICFSNVNWLSKIKPKFLASVDGKICVLPTFIEMRPTLFSCCRVPNNKISVFESFSF